VARGFISGLVWGVLVSGIAGVGASVIHSGSYLAQQPAPMTEAKQGEVASQADAPKDPPATETAPQVVRPPANTAAQQDQSTQESATTDQTTADASTIDPVAPAQPVEPSNESTPATDTTTQSDVEPAKLTQPETDQMNDTAADSAPDTAPDTAPQKPANDQLALLPVEPAQEKPAQPSGTLPQIEIAPKEPVETPPADTGEGDAVQTDTKQAEAEPLVEKPAKSIMEPVPGITGLAPNVETGRLPSIGREPGAEADAQAQASPAPDQNQGALLAFAAAFENPNSLPMMSVILIDNPDMPVAEKLLADLPFAVSFAIDAVREDAAEVAAKYRKAGFEVLMLTNLPLGVEASDIEVAFQAYSRAVPEAVAVLDLGANGFLRGASTATQIAGILADGGLGLVTPSKGLNTAQKVAMREGVPAALIYRQLDDGDEKAAVIRRYLDRAAFRAKQEGHVIMLGQTRPETIEALVQWALEDRAASVAMAPVSAVLNGF